MAQMYATTTRCCPKCARKLRSVQSLPKKITAVSAMILSACWCVVCSCAKGKSGGIVDSKMTIPELVATYPFFRQYKPTSMRKFINQWFNTREMWNQTRVSRSHKTTQQQQFMTTTNDTLNAGAKLDNKSSAEDSTKPEEKPHAKKVPTQTKWDTPTLKTGDYNFNVGSYVPATMQTVTTDTKHHQHLLVVIDMPGHIQAKGQVSIDLVDSQNLGITCPRGCIATTDIEGLTTFLCGFSSIDEQDAKMFGHSMEELVLRSQMRKNNNKKDPIYDKAVIPLEAEVEVGKGLFSILIQNGQDRSASLIVILDLPVEIGYGKEDCQEE